MIRLLFFAALACGLYRLVAGRWPWQRRLASRESFALAHARAVLGVGERAGRQEILDAHRRLIASVHPDRGGSNEKVHEANAARDMLIAALTSPTQERQ
jgi:DnaJ family protein C protein 19